MLAPFPLIEVSDHNKAVVNLRKDFALEFERRSGVWTVSDLDVVVRLENDELCGIGISIDRPGTLGIGGNAFNGMGTNAAPSGPQIQQATEKFNRFIRQRGPARDDR